MDQDLQKQLQTIEAELKSINKAVSETWKKMFFRGLFRGGGFVIGTALSIAIAGWVLSALGIIPLFGDIANELQTILRQSTP